MNGSRAGTADRARAAGIANAPRWARRQHRPAGPLPSPGARDGLEEGRSPWRPRPSSRRSTPGFAGAAARPAEVPKFRSRPLS